jgi:hypothetical protein
VRGPRLRDKKCRQVEEQCQVALRNNVLPHRPLSEEEKARDGDGLLLFPPIPSHPIPVSVAVHYGTVPSRVKTLLEASQFSKPPPPSSLTPLAYSTVSVEPLTAEQPSRLHALPCPALPALPCPDLSCLALPCPSFWEQQQHLPLASTSRPGRTCANQSVITRDYDL